MTSHTHHGISTHWQLYCLLNSYFRLAWKKTSSRSSVRGSHWRWNRRTLNHQSSTPVIPCDGNPLVPSGFTEHRATHVINCGMTNYRTVIWYEFHEFSTQFHDNHPGVLAHNSQNSWQVGMQAFYDISVRYSFHHIYGYWYDLRLWICNQNYSSVYVYITPIIDNWVTFKMGV